MLVWMAPRDMCALMATTKAQRLVLRKLSDALSLSTSSPEILFAMTTFHKFYVKFYNACLQANELHLDRHELVKVPTLVFHILHSLGFCTYIDENGVERVVRDKSGIPVCGDFLNAFRTAHSRTTWSSHPILVASGVRLIDTLFNTKKLLSVSKDFKDLHSRLHASRPTRFASLTFAAKLNNYESQSNIWEEVNTFWENALRPLDQALSAIEKKKSENNLSNVRTQYSNLMRYENDHFLQKQLKKVEDLKYKESGGRRDQHALEWKRSFEGYLKDLIVFVNNLITTLQPKFMQGDIELATTHAKTDKAYGTNERDPDPTEKKLTAWPHQSRGLHNESSAEAPTSETHSTAESRTEESSPSSASTEEIQNVPVLIGWEKELCFERHADLKNDCERDKACYYRAGACRDKQPQMMRESRAMVYGSIADRERKTKPPVDMPYSHYALKQEEFPPKSRKERKLSQKESETERDLTSSKITRKQSQQRKKTNTQNLTAYNRIKPSVVKKDRAYCNIPMPKECEEAMDCMWDGVRCVSQTMETEDIRTTKTKKLSHPKPAQHFRIAP